MGDDLHLKDISFEDLLDADSGHADEIECGGLVDDDFRNAASGEVSYIFSSGLSKSAIDSTKSSPCSPILSFLEENEVAKPSQRQRSYSDSRDNLNAQDRACLEEIERGSQVTLEDQELFDILSKKKPDSEGGGGGGLGKNGLSETNDRSLLSQNVTKNLNELKGVNDATKQGSSALKQLLLTNIANSDKKKQIRIVTLPSKANQSAFVNNASSLSSTASLSDRIQTLSNSVVVNPSQTQGDSLINRKTGNSNISFQNGTSHGVLNTAPVESKAETGRENSQTIMTIKRNDGDDQNKTLNLILSPGVKFRNGMLIIPLNKDGKLTSAVKAENVVLPETVQAESEEPKDALNGGMQFIIQNQQQEPVDSEQRYGEKVYVCEECHQAFNKPSKLNAHVMYKHTGERPFKCDFPKCNWAFTANYKLQRHRACHEKKKTCMCPVEGCGKLYSNIYNLNQHMKLHARPQSFACTACDQSFGTQKKLDLHMKQHGDQYKTYKCPIEGCDKMFYSNLSMGSHLKTHKRPSVYVCGYEGCGKEFTMPCKLTAHERIHTKEKPFECPYPLCSARFGTSSHLTRHLKTHTNERNFVCQQCGKAFLRAEHLRSHMMSHTGERPHACWYPNCNASFSARSTLYVHMKRHPRSDLSPMLCPLDGCEQRFNDKTTLRTHIDHHFGRHGDALAEVPETAAPPAKLLEESAVNTTTSLTLTPTSVVTSQVTADNAMTSPAAITSSAVTPQVGVENGTMAFFNVSFNPQQTVGPVLITPELAHSLIAASGESMVTNDYMAPEQAQEMVQNNQALVHASADSGEKEEKESGGYVEGCARTDYYRNHMLSVTVRKRRQILKQKAAQAGIDLASFQDIANNSKLVSCGITDSSDGAQGPVMNPNEVMTSRAITIRDPETGAVYVQTQLLQDDPPNMEFEESSQETTTIGAKSLLSDLRTLKQEPHLSTASVPPPSDIHPQTLSLNSEAMDTNDSSQLVSYSDSEERPQLISFTDVVGSNFPATETINIEGRMHAFDMISQSGAGPLLENVDMTSQSVVNQFAVIDSEGRISSEVIGESNDAIQGDMVPIQVITKSDGSLHVLSESNVPLQVVNDSGGTLQGVNVVSAEEIANSALILQDLVNSSSS